MTNVKTIAVIGGGAVGTSVCYQLVEELAQVARTCSVRILLFEKSAVVGPGVAYQSDDAPFLLNRSVEGMSAIHDRPNDFLEWAVLNRKVTLPLPADGVYLRRSVFGEYLKSVFSSAHRAARKNGFVLDVVHEEAFQIENTDNGRHQISVSGGQEFVVDVVVLALGNLPSRRFKNLEGGSGYIPSPYPSVNLKNAIDPSASVIVLGTRLSAVDTILALDQQEHRGPIYMVSREGRIPSIRSLSETRLMKFLTKTRIQSLSEFGNRTIPMSEILFWISKELEDENPDSLWSWEEKKNPVNFLRRDLEAAGRSSRTWQSLGVALNEVIELLWHSLSEPDQRAFQKYYQSIWMSYRVPIPEESGRRLLALLERGKVQIFGGLSEIRLDPESGGFEAILGTFGSLRSEVVINATGSPTNLEECDSVLIDNLRSSGWIKPHPLGGLDIDFESSRIKNATGKKHPHAYAVGNLTSGALFFTSVLELNVKRAASIAQQIATEISIETIGVEYDESPSSLPTQGRPFTYPHRLGLARDRKISALHFGG
jgi:uncharacterized NAD(P)/FAD-binding protein YdhS